MIQHNNMALLSAESANEIAFLFNAFNSMVGINGATVLHGDSSAKILVGDFNQAANPYEPIPMIQAGDTETYLSASRINLMIRAYNRIMAFQGDGIIEPKLSDGGPCIDVLL